MDSTKRGFYGALPLATQQISGYEVNLSSFKIRVLSIEPTVDDSQLIHWYTEYLLTHSKDNTNKIVIIKGVREVKIFLWDCNR